MGAFCFIPLLILRDRTDFGEVYVSLSSLVHEADGSGSLDLRNVNIERCTSVSTLGFTELISMEKEWTGIIFALKRKTPFALNPELPCDTGAAFSNLSH
jgi:hypothetical protein